MANRQWLLEEMQNMSDEELVKNVCLSSFVCMAKPYNIEELLNENV